jgi:hypothetical protein
MRVWASLALLIGDAAITAALDNGLGKLPGLGWNSDYCVNCTSSLLQLGAGPNSQNEKFVKHIADHIHTHQYKMTGGGMKTMQELGFHYVNIDANWDLSNRSASGELVPDPSLYPSGLNHTVSYVHSLGLGFGLCESSRSLVRSFVRSLARSLACPARSQTEIVELWTAEGRLASSATRRRTRPGSARTKSTGSRATRATPRTAANLGTRVTSMRFTSMSSCVTASTSRAILCGGRSAAGRPGVSVRSRSLAGSLADRHTIDTRTYLA